MLEPKTTNERIWSIYGMLLAANIAAQRRAYLAANEIRKRAISLADEYGLVITSEFNVVQEKRPTKLPSDERSGGGE